MEDTRRRVRQTDQDDEEWTVTIWDHAVNWTDAELWSSEWSKDLWIELVDTTVVIDENGLRTVQSNVWRKYLTIKRFDDEWFVSVMGVSKWRERR